jgi:peptide/nickel transport system substrate-binding protein
MQAFQEYQASIGVDAQKGAASEIERILMEDSSTLFPYFFNFLSAHNKEFANIGVTAMGHMFLGNAGRVA